MIQLRFWMVATLCLSLAACEASDGDGGDGSGGDGDVGSGGAAGDGDGDAGDGDAGDGDTGDGDAGDGDTGDGDAGDGDGGPGVVYISEYAGVWRYDVDTDTATELGDFMPPYASGTHLMLSPSGTRLAFGGPHVVDTSDGTDLFTGDANVDRFGPWLDDDVIFYQRPLDFGRCNHDGSGEQVYEQMYSSGTAGRWAFSPARDRIAFKNNQTGHIHTVPVTGPGDETDTNNTADCTPPIWLPNGVMVGVCINTSEVYLAEQGDTNTTRVDLGLDADIIGAIRWTGDDKVLVRFKNGPDGGFYVIDSIGQNLGKVDWLGGISSAALKVENVRLSKDESTVLYVTGETHMADAADGSNDRVLDIGAVPIAIEWSAGN